MNATVSKSKQQARRLETLRHLQDQARRRITARRQHALRLAMLVSVAWLAAAALILILPIEAREFWLVAGTAGTIGVLFCLGGARRWFTAEQAEDSHDALAAIRYELTLLELQFPDPSRPGLNGETLTDLQNHVRALRASRDAQRNDTAEAQWQRSPYRLMAYLLLALLLAALFSRLAGPVGPRPTLAASPGETIVPAVKPVMPPMRPAGAGMPLPSLPPRIGPPHSEPGATSE